MTTIFEFQTSDVCRGFGVGLGREASPSIMGYVTCYSYLRHWTGITLQLRLTQGNMYRVSIEL